MSTSITKGTWEIAIYDQKEMISELHYWRVDVWQNHDFLRSDNPSQAKCLWSRDNFDWDNYKLTEDTLDTVVGKAVEFIKGEQSER